MISFVINFIFRRRRFAIDCSSRLNMITLYDTVLNHKF